MDSLIVQFGMFFIGIVVLFFGAEWLVKGSSRLAKGLGIRPIIIGATIVAFATSSPEFVVSFTAALQKSKDIALGNIIGSNIANIGLILGISALIRPLKVNLSTLRNELPIMIFVSIGFYLLALNHKIGFWNGILLICGIICYISYQIIVSLKDHNDNKAREKQYKSFIKNGSTFYINILRVILGLGGLVLGSQLMLKSGIYIAKTFGISDLVIGLTILAIGTSLPELATSIISALRKEADICIGNVIGSNVFNILFVVGMIAIINPLTVEPPILGFELPVMLGFSILLFPLLAKKRELNRWGGGLLVIGYLAFIFVLLR